MFAMALSTDDRLITICKQVGYFYGVGGCNRRMVETGQNNGEDMSNNGLPTMEELHDILQKQIENGEIDIND